MEQVAQGAGLRSVPERQGDVTLLRHGGVKIEIEGAADRLGRSDRR